VTSVGVGMLVEVVVVVVGVRGKWVIGGRDE